MAWIPKTLKALTREKIISSGPNFGNGAATHAFILNTTAVDRLIADLKSSFPESALHAYAAKANHLQGVLDHLSSRGLGCETASIGEFRAAQRSFDAAKIVFDSPVKTEAELRHALYLPCFVNVDNFQELERVAAIHAEKPITATVGIRINPQLGAGAIGCLSTALATSKFGIPLEDEHAKLLEAYKTHSFLKMVHVHTGSQGIGLTMMTQGVKRIVEFANAVKEHGGDVSIVDIGGGLPVNFASDEDTPSFSDYASQLRTEAPILFAPDSPYRMITEFGRALSAKAGFLASRVEYVKVAGGRRIVQQHIGVDLAIRTVWAPDAWPLRIDAFDGESGELLTADPSETDVAGPCCLGGDLIGRKIQLASTKPGDIVIAKDTGAYYFSGYSLYNLRQCPGAYLYNEESDSLRCIRRPVTVDETLDMVATQA